MNNRAKKTNKNQAMKLIVLTFQLLLTYIIALLQFSLMGFIGWIGIILLVLKLFCVIHWNWWLVLLPLEYGALYCIYMTIDGALLKAGKKEMGKYAKWTSGLE
jgi:hypothetical protein